MFTFEETTQLLNGMARHPLYTDRYPSRNVHRRESAAEHTFYTVLYSLMLGKRLQDCFGYKLDMGTLLSRATVHHLNLLSVGSNWLASIRQGAEESSLENETLDVAEVMSTVAYLCAEHALGNTTLSDICVEMYGRATFLESHIKNSELAEIAQHIELMLSSILKIGRTSNAEGVRQ